MFAAESSLPEGLQYEMPAPVALSVDQQFEMLAVEETDAQVADLQEELQRLQQS